MNRIKPRTALLFIIGALVLLMLAIAISAASKPKLGTLLVQLQLPDYQNLELSVDDKALPVKNLRPSYQLKAGSHHLSVIKAGYTDFSTDVTVAANETATVNVILQRKSAPSTAELPGRVIDELQISGLTVTHAEYFYQRSWAFASIRTPDDNEGFVIARYNDAARKWEVVEGPGTQFSEESIVNIPADVASYMRRNNYVEGGAVDVQ